MARHFADRPCLVVELAHGMQQVLPTRVRTSAVPTVNYASPVKNKRPMFELADLEF